MLLSIGEISKMFNISIQTLRFYDKQKLFVPQYRDEKTGYRKYAFEQIYSLALICYLRRAGFSIDQIKSYMNLRSPDLAIKQLKEQSILLKNQYQMILNIDSAIQRKIKYVEDERNNINLQDVSVKHYPKRAYFPLGDENVLYQNETFYFYPTLAFYTFHPETNTYTTTFGAYIDPEITIKAQYADQIKFIDEQDFLCFYNKGKYEKIVNRIESVRNEYQHLKLSHDTVNCNIIDQFLEKDMDNYITEIQIPLL